MLKITTRTSRKELAYIKKFKSGYIRPAEYVRDTRELLSITKLYAMKYGSLGFSRVIKLLEDWG